MKEVAHQAHGVIIVPTGTVGQLSIMHRGLESLERMTFFGQL